MCINDDLRRLLKVMISEELSDETGMTNQRIEILSEQLIQRLWPILLEVQQRLKN